MPLVLRKNTQFARACLASLCLMLAAIPAEAQIAGDQYYEFDREREATGGDDSTIGSSVIYAQEAEISVSPARLDWTGAPSGYSDKQVSISNGGQLLSLGTLSVAVTGPYNLTANACTRLTAGQSCDIRVAPSSSNHGGQTGEVIITSQSGARATVPLETEAQPARSCAEAWSLGQLSISGNGQSELIELDPDGPGTGQPPFPAECEIADGQAWIVLWRVGPGPLLYYLDGGFKGPGANTGVPEDVWSLNGTATSSYINNAMDGYSQPKTWGLTFSNWRVGSPSHGYVNFSSNPTQFNRSPRQLTFESTRSVNPSDVLTPDGYSIFQVSFNGTFYAPSLMPGLRPYEYSLLGFHLTEDTNHASSCRFSGAYGPDIGGNDTIFGVMCTLGQDPNHGGSTTACPASYHNGFNFCSTIPVSTLNMNLPSGQTHPLVGYRLMGR